jgi:hypothetical protein
VIVSASMGPGSAYSVDDAESFVYRKNEDGGKWRFITNGLPGPDGTTITIFVANSKVSGEFFAVNNLGLYYQLILVIHGRNLILLGQENTFHRLLGPLQLARSNQ